MIKNSFAFVLIERIGNEIQWKELGYALLSLLPIFISFLIFKELLILKIGLITMSLFISATRLKLSVNLISLHYVLIIAGFSLLYFFINNTLIFAFLCASIAFGSIYIMCYGRKLRTFANFTFIPSIYLACEIQNNFPTTAWPGIYWKFIMISPIAWMTIISLKYFFTFFQFKNYSILKTSSNKPHIQKKIIINLETGEPYKEWLLPGLAIFTGVFISAVFASLLHIDNAEWLIWSTASVINIDFFTSKAKLLHRSIGVLLGISIGLIVGQFLPKTEVVYSLSILSVMLTLVSFKTYFISFSSRCFFITLAACAISNTQFIAFSRIENVIMGGLIGLMSICLFYLLFRHTSTIDKQ